jgi:hypothetical protein
MAIAALCCDAFLEFPLRTEGLATAENATRFEAAAEFGASFPTDTPFVVSPSCFLCCSVSFVNISESLCETFPELSSRIEGLAAGATLFEASSEFWACFSFDTPFIIPLSCFESCPKICRMDTDEFGAPFPTDETPIVISSSCFLCCSVSFKSMSASLCGVLTGFSILDGAPAAADGRKGKTYTRCGVGLFFWRGVRHGRHNFIILCRPRKAAHGRQCPHAWQQ